MERSKPDRYHGQVSNGGGEGAGLERISVVLATFNGEHYLQEQLDSLAGQTTPPDELIIIDDGSTDATPGILRAFAASAPFPTELVLRSEHLGTWATFEEGLTLATGDIILICDQDDRWHADKVGVLASRLAERPETLMAFSDARLINAGGRIIGRSRWRVAGFSPRQARAMAADSFGPLTSRQAVSGCTLAIRSELLPAILPFPSAIHPALPTMMYDRWISLVASAAASVVTVPETLVDYRIHPGQQIGIPALSIRRVAPRFALQCAQFLHSRAEVIGRIEYHVAHLEEIHKRLIVAGLSTEASEQRLEVAERHLRFRASLDRRRRARVPVVIQELRRLDGYRRFSLGVVTAVSDVTR